MFKADGKFRFEGKDYPEEFLDFVYDCIIEMYGDDGMGRDRECLISSVGIPCLFTLFRHGDGFLGSVSYHSFLGDFDYHVILPHFDIDDIFKDCGIIDFNI